MVLMSCNDDTENPYAHTPTLQVVSSNVVFTAKAASGDVVFATTNGGTLTAKTKSPWAKATVNGNTVTVNVEENDDLSGRSTQLTVYNGTDSANVTVQQEGLIFRLSTASISTGDNASRQSFAITKNIDPTIEVSQDWITTQMTDDSLIVTLKENATGHVRNGYIYYTAGTKRDSISVTQADFDKDIAGTWLITSSNSEKAYRVTIGRNGNKYAMVLAGLNWTIPLSYNKTTNALSIAAGDSIGMYKDYYIGTVFYDMEAGYITWSKSVTLSGTFGHNDAEGYSFLEFKDNGSWEGYKPNSLLLSAFTSSSFSNKTYSDTDLLELDNPTLIRLDK